MGRELPLVWRINHYPSPDFRNVYPVIMTVVIASAKNKTLKPMVIRKSVFSMPRRAVKMLPLSAPVKPPKPAPLLCKITLKIRAIDVIINAISRYLSTQTSARILTGICQAGGLYLSPSNSSNHIMHEIIVNLHMHTTYSDGSGTHALIAKAALDSGLDAVITTDHNVLVNGPSGYYHEKGKRTLLIIGEEVHDQSLQPAKNHLLVFGAGQEVATLAHAPQRLIDTIQEMGGLAFIAHPVDPAAPVFGEPDISWEFWEARNFTGIELWNAMSEFKSLLTNKLRALFYALNPSLIATGPFPATIRKWDELLAHGKRVVVIGGSDAHALPARLGPLRRVLFPYAFHFRAINTHVLLPGELEGEAISDSHIILDSLRQGHAFIGYDLPASTCGFRFTAHGKDGRVWMGDKIPLGDGVTLQVNLPRRVECRLIKDGNLIKVWTRREVCTYITREPGVYRIEAYIDFLGKRRGWIFSNPIYIRAGYSGLS